MIENTEATSQSSTYLTIDNGAPVPGVRTIGKRRSTGERASVSVLHGWWLRASLRALVVILSTGLPCFGWWRVARAWLVEFPNFTSYRAETACWI
jgi:hypothetical protein